MPDTDRFRDAATVDVQAPVGRVRELLADPDVLREVDERLTDSDLEIQREEDRVEVWGGDERLHLAFRLADEGGRTRVAALEDVEPEGLLERTKWMLFPGRSHADLEEELDRFRSIAEALESRGG